MKFFKLIIVLVIGVFLFPFIFSLLLVPSFKKYRTENPVQTKFMKYYLKKNFVVNSQSFIGYEFVSLEEIPPSLIQAVIFAEDCNFYRHHGVDWQSAYQSFKENQLRGKIVHGGSTITMQLCKNLFLYPQKTFWRKIIEMILASRMERIVNKKRILELYLNLIEWGPGIYGAENAAQYYFDKSVRDLDLKESAFLASLIMGPRLYKFGQQNRFFEKREEWILSHLLNRDLKSVQSFEVWLSDAWPEEIFAEKDSRMLSVFASNNIELVPENLFSKRDWYNYFTSANLLLKKE